MQLKPIVDGSTGDEVKHLQSATRKRLNARSAGAQAQNIKVDGEFGPASRKYLRYACYLLGMDAHELNGIEKGTISEAEQLFVRQPSRRTPDQIKRGKVRVAAHRKALAKQEKERAQASNQRKRIVELAKEAAANYRKNPTAYHYLAGGVANLEFLRPTPRNYRSDCSQFVASVYKAAGVESPAAPLAHQWASTYSIVKSPHARIISAAQRKPGDLGMYGSRTAPHHVELWCGDEFVGHGSPPIDSLTPGQPDYYVTFDFLN
jgi:cell wall-associated NlpC family hydrolase